MLALKCVSENAGVVKAGVGEGFCCGRRPVPLQVYEKFRIVNIGVKSKVCT